MRIYLLGGFRLLLDDAPLSALETPRQQALLAWLLLHRDTPQPRQQLAFLFWPDSTDAQAQTNLRQLLHTLRQRLPDASRYLSIDERSVQWRGDASYTLDLVDFEGALVWAQQSNGQDKLSALEEAVAHYQGDLLPGLYEEWVLAAREQLSQRFMTALETLIDLYEDRRELKPAIAHAQRLLRHDPLHEATYRQLMRLHALDGDRVAALRVYHTCATLLDRELGVPPSETTQEAYAQLMQAARTTAETPVPQAALGWGLVGRHREWVQLQQAWRVTAGGQAHCVFVVGEAGIGKSRLADELLAWAGQQGIPHAATRCYAMQGSLPLAPVIEWLRGELFQPLLAQLPAAERDDLALLLPELRGSGSGPPLADAASEGWQRTRLFAALARAIKFSRGALLLVIDDLHWCDPETLEWLYFLLQHKANSGLLLICTLRPEEVGDDHPATLLRLKLQSKEQVTEIGLPPLDAAETALLANGVARRRADPIALGKLFRETEGNPLFVVETVRMQMDAGVENQRGPASPKQVAALSPKVQATIQTRLLRLSNPARELASVAAVIGRAFAFDVLAQASGVDQDGLVGALDELWQRRIVREQGRGEYDFSHDRIREVAYAQISRARRRLLHRRVALALEQAHAPALADVSGLLAAHYEKAGMAEQAVAWYWRAVENGRQRFSSHRDGLASLRKGLALLATLPQTPERQSQRLSFLLGLGLTLNSMEGPIGDEVRGIFGEAELLSRQLGEKQQQYVAQRGQWSGFLNRLLIPQAQEQAVRNLALAQELGDPRALRDAYTNWGLASIEVGDFAQAVGYLELALAQQPAEHLLLPVAAGFELGIDAAFFRSTVLCLLGYTEQAQGQAQSALQAARALGDPFTLIPALYFASQFFQIARDMPALRAATAEMVELAARYEIFAFLYDGSILLEWGEALQTGQVAATARLHEHLTNYIKTDNYQLTYFYGLAAEACHAVGRRREALTTIDTALALVESSGERFWCAELNRLQGEIRLALGEEEVEVCFQTALAIARQQQAKLLELRAALSLGRLWQAQGKGEEARQLVAGVYEWFSEGFETPDLRIAWTFLRLP